MRSRPWLGLEQRSVERRSDLPGRVARAGQDTSEKNEATLVPGARLRLMLQCRSHLLEHCSVTAALRCASRCRRWAVCFSVIGSPWTPTAHLTFVRPRGFLRQVFNTRTSTTLTKHFEGSPECSQGEHYAVKARIDGFREAERVAMATGRLEEAQEERAASAAAAEDAAPEAEADLEEMDVDSSPPRGGVDDSHDEGAAGGGSDDGGGGGGERPASPRLVEAVEARGGEGGAETATEEEQMPVVGPSLSAAAAGAAAASGGGSSGAGTAAGAAVDVSSSEEAMAAAVASLSAARDTEAEEWLVQEIDRERELLDGQTSEEEGEDVQGEEEEEEESEKEGAELVDGLDSAAGDEERAKAAKRQREEWLDAVASTCGGRIEGIYKEIASFSDYEWLCFHHCQVPHEDVRDYEAPAVRRASFILL